MDFGGFESRASTSVLMRRDDRRQQAAGQADCALKRNMRPHDTILRVGIDAEEGTKCERGIGLDRGQLAIHLNLLLSRFACRD